MQLNVEFFVLTTYHVFRCSELTTGQQAGRKKCLRDIHRRFGEEIMDRGKQEEMAQKWKANIDHHIL